MVRTYDCGDALMAMFDDGVEKIFEWHENGCHGTAVAVYTPPGQ
jgi:hypothetical protein